LKRRQFLDRPRNDELPEQRSTCSAQRASAVPILGRYRDKICTYNDDIQGTAAVALAGIFAALRITGQKITDQRFLFLGGGSAGTGIAELISQAMAFEGMNIAEARARNALFDIHGLIVTSRGDLAEFQRPFATTLLCRCGKRTTLEAQMAQSGKSIHRAWLWIGVAGFIALANFPAP
jgi:malic enzyme